MKIKTIKMILESFKKDAKNVSYEDVENLYNKLSKKEQKFVAPREYYIDSPKLFFRLGEYDKDDLMAFIDIYEFKKGEGFIIIAVIPEHRGKGLAKKLLNKAIKEAKEKGLKKLIYKVDNINKPSISFIERILVKDLKKWKKIRMISFLKKNCEIFLFLMRRIPIIKCRIKLDDSSNLIG